MRVLQLNSRLALNPPKWGVNLVGVIANPIANQPIAEMAMYGFPRFPSVCFPGSSQRFESNAFAGQTQTFRRWIHRASTPQELNCRSNELTSGSIGTQAN